MIIITARLLLMIQQFHTDISYLACSIAQKIPEFLDIVIESELSVR
jgi:hypothetical protein